MNEDNEANVGEIRQKKTQQTLYKTQPWKYQCSLEGMLYQNSMGRKQIGQDLFRPLTPW